MPKSQTVWGIDIGTGKTACALMEIDDQGGLFVRNVAAVGSQGIKLGTIHGYQLLSHSLGAVLKQAQAGQRLKKRLPTVVNLSGQNILVRRLSFKVSSKDKVPKIKKKELDQLDKQIAKAALPKGEQLLHQERLAYILDGSKMVEDPLGLPGRHLEQQVLRISIVQEEVKDLVGLLERHSLQPVALTFSPYATSEVLLSEEEKQSGVIHFEIGAGVSNISLWRNNRLEMSENFFVAGNHVENDIAQVLKISISQARKLLFEQGQVMPSEIVNKQVSIQSEDGAENYTVGHEYLCKIIQARIHEILSLGWHRLQRWKKFTPLPRQIVLSGGLSQITKIEEFCARMFEMPVRRGIPEEKWQLIDDPMYATAIGLVLHGVRQGYFFQKKNFFQKLWG